MHRIVLLIIGIALVPRQSSAQTQRPFEPLPGTALTGYRFNLTRNFYPDSAAAEQARKQLELQFKRVGASARSVHDAASLLALFAQSDTLTRSLGRQYAYLSLRTALDTRDVKAQRDLADLAAGVEPVFTEIERAFGKITERRFNAYVRSVPALSRYRYAWTRATRAATHRLDERSERVLAATEAEATGWGPALFQTMLATTAWGTVHSPDGDLDVRRQGNGIRSSIDRGVRERGFRLSQAGLASRRDTYAFILTGEANARNAIARHRAWPDYPTQSFAAGELSPDRVRALLSSIASRAELNKRYERLRVAEIRRDFEYDSVHVWDLTAPTPHQVAPRFTIEDATTHVQSAAAPLGPSYLRELTALLDPANGRLDLVPRPNRVDRAGFSTGSVGYPSMFFQGRFEGYVSDLVILSHEAGHAVQNMLMDSAGVLPRYASGPNYFTESFATLSQLVLLEHLYRTSTTSADSAYHLRRLLDDGLDLFRNAHEATIELQLYDSVAAGRFLDADGIERLSQETGKSFSIWFGTGDERAFAWVQPLQFYTRPLYRVNYAIAKLLALKYLDMLHRNPSEFQRQYLNLLRNGYDAPPDDLLQKFLGFRLADTEALAAGAVRVIEEWLAEVKE